MANSVFLVLVCLGLTATGVHAICDTVEMAKCVKDFEPHLKAFGENVALDGEEFDKVCSVLNTVVECVVRQTDTCDPSVVAAWNAIGDAFNYLCLDHTKKVYLRHQQCLIEKNVAAKISRCDKRAVEAINAADVDDDTSVCRFYNDGVSCNIGAIKDCGTEIAEVFNQFYKKLQSIVYEAIGCTSDVTVAKARYDAGTSGSATKLDTFHGALLLIMSFIVLAL